MTNHPAEADSNLFSGVDLRAFWETLRLRWWVVPAVVGVCVAFLWAQETNLQTEPGSYSVSRIFEARNSTGVLASVGVDPLSVRPFPDANNQLILLQSEQVRREISQQIGTDAVVNVSRSQPSFSLIDTLESDGRSSFIFQSFGASTYSFSCTESVRSNCMKAIDAYVERFMEIRSNALSAGLNDLKKLLVEVSSETNQDETATKLAAIDVLLSDSDTPMLEIASSEQALGPTLSYVQRPTYVFGVAAGLLISLLILLQLTYSDKRIRSARQVTRVVGSQRMLGVVSRSVSPVSDRRTSVALHRVVSDSTAHGVRFIVLRHRLSDDIALRRIMSLAGDSFSISKPFGDLSVQEITDSGSAEIDVVITQRNVDLRRDLAETIAALEKSGRPFGGVVLID